MGSHVTSCRNNTTVAETSAGTPLSQQEPQPQQAQPKLATILPLPYVNVNRIIDIPRQKRSKAKRSCDQCRKRRIRCNADTIQPCHGCKSAGVECHFLDNSNSNRDQSKQLGQAHIESFEDRVSRLENIIQGVQNKHSGYRQQQRQNDMPGEENEEEEDEEHMGKGMTSGILTVSKQHHEGVDGSVATALCGLEVVPVNPTLEMVEHMSLLQINDYEQTRYIGSSSGIHLLDQSLFNNNLIHRIVYDKPSAESWVAQKINNDITEHIIMKAEARELSSSSALSSPGPSSASGSDVRLVSHKKLTVLEDIPHLTDELVELMMHA